MYSTTRKRSYSNRGSGKSTFTSSKMISTRMDYRSKDLYPKLIRYPFKLNQDVRIPDGQALVPTCTFDVNFEFDVQLNSDGVGGFCVGLTSKTMLWQLGAGLTASKFLWDGEKSKIYLPSAYTTNINQNSATFINALRVSDNVIPTESFWTQIDTNFRGYRLVAAGAKVEFVGNDTNNSGVIQMCQINGGIISHVTQLAGEKLDSSDFTEKTTADAQRYVESNSYVSNLSDWLGPVLSNSSYSPNDLVGPATLVPLQPAASQTTSSIYLPTLS